MVKVLVMKVKCFVNQRDFSCNVFVCSDDKGAFIVDLGYYDSEIKKYLSSLPELKFVLQTHGHLIHLTLDSLHTILIVHFNFTKMNQCGFYHL